LSGPLSGPLIGPLSRTSSGVRILFNKIVKIVNYVDYEEREKLYDFHAVVKTDING